MERTEPSRSDDRPDYPRSGLVTVDIGPAPLIEVSLHIQAGDLTKVTLSTSPQFSVSAPARSPAFEKALLWLTQYSKGQESPFELPLLPDSFRRDVLEFLIHIPRGTVFSYQQVACAVGNQQAARAVGNICRTNLFPLFIPCHRVIKADGRIGSYTPNPSLKSQLLDFEGYRFN